MKNNGFRIFAFIITLFVSLALFLGGYSLYRDLEVKKPTVKGLSALSGGQVKWEKKDQIIEISLNPGSVDNLQQTWIAMTDLIEKKTTREKYRIKLQDQRNPALQSTFEALHPAIYEALATNGYVGLKREIDQQLQGSKIEYKLFLDNERLYLQMEDGEHYLYEVIERVAVQNPSPNGS